MTFPFWVTTLVYVDDDVVVVPTVATFVLLLV
jgi:hypothetical protein